MVIDKRKIFWHSRRGMLELDLLLVPFALQAFEQLNSADQCVFESLLKEEDQDLFAWLMRRQKPADARYQEIIAQILSFKPRPD